MPIGEGAWDCLGGFRVPRPPCSQALQPFKHLVGRRVWVVAALRVAMDTCTFYANHAWLHHIKTPSPSSSIGDEFKCVYMEFRLHGI